MAEEKAKKIAEEIAGEQPKKVVRVKKADPEAAPKAAARPVKEGAAKKPSEGAPAEAEAPKKKKMTVVFRTQNSAQNSLKTRPAGQMPPRKPAARPAAPGKAPAARRPLPSDPEKKAAVRPAEEPAKPVKPEAPAKPAPAAAAPEKAEPKKPAAPASAPVPAPAPAAEKPAAEKPAAEKPAAEKPAPAAPAEKKEERPAPRFVDMAKVRAADNVVIRRRRDSSTAPGGAGRRPAGQAWHSGDGRPGGYRPQGAGGPGRPGQGGPRPGGPGRPGQGGPGGAGRPGQGGGRPAGGGYADVGMSKPGAKNQKGRGQAAGGNRYDKKNNSDGLRRPSGVKVSNKDLSRPAKNARKEPEEPKIKMITIPESLTIKELADAMKVQPAVIIKKLFLAGKVVTVNQEIDYETAADIAVEFDVLCEKEVTVNVLEEIIKDTTEDPEESLVPRPPVVCVMGHVDHGKTSLLDAIRNTHVIDREAGGITQHIGAYMVHVHDRDITFLDTPGHEAFTAMRMRGAKSTDIAILVVAADDGVMPQTVEAINHAKAAGVEIVVAVNKIDKPGANVERVKQELTEHELVAEDWGGSTIFVPVSAKTGEGIEELLEMVLLTADIKELKANPNRNARGLVIEAQLDKGRGPVATVLVQKGTLHVGDTVAAGACYGKVRAMIDENGRPMKAATPGMPAAILGLSDVPSAGEVFVATDTEKDARTYAETFIAENKKKLLDETRSKLSLDDLFQQIQAGNVKELDLILKADVQGSVEAVKESLVKLSNDEVVVKVIHGGVGNINESDVTLAAASNAIVIGFNVKCDAMAKATAEQEKVDVRLYKVIYKAIEDIEAAMKGMLDPVYEERILGHAVVRQTFKASAIGIIAGCMVTDGKVVRGCKCRVSRGGEQLYDGPLVSLKRFKDDVKEVVSGYECGLVFDGFGNLQEDDAIEAYDMVEVSRA